MVKRLVSTPADHPGGSPRRITPADHPGGSSRRITPADLTMRLKSSYDQRKLNLLIWIVDYLKVVVSSLNTANNKQCVSQIQQATNIISNLIADTDGRQILKNYFKWVHNVLYSLLYCV